MGDMKGLGTRGSEDKLLGGTRGTHFPGQLLRKVKKASFQLKDVF